MWKQLLMMYRIWILKIKLIGIVVVRIFTIWEFQSKVETPWELMQTRVIGDVWFSTISFFNPNFVCGCGGGDNSITLFGTTLDDSAVGNY